MATDLARAYRACARMTRRTARNFYFAFLSLPQAQRRAVYALYAFCREADDCADAGASAEEKRGFAALLPQRFAKTKADDVDDCADAGVSAEKKRGFAALLPQRFAKTKAGNVDDCADPGAIAPASTEENGHAGVDVDTAASTGENSTAVLPAGSVSDSPVDLAARRTGLEELRDRLAQAADGTPKTERDLALADAIARYGVREEDLRDVLTGVEMDVTSTRIETYDELRTYCYHVASAVGLATLPVLTDGIPPTEAMREAAIDLGLGMQYVNILRDVGEDLALGRIYLPSEELTAHGVDELQLRARTMSAGLRAALATHGDRAGAHLARGRRLLAYLPRRSRACPWLLSEIYGRILARIVEADYRVFGGRVSLPAIEKLWLLVSSAWRRV